MRCKKSALPRYIRHMLYPSSSFSVWTSQALSCLLPPPVTCGLQVTRGSKVLLLVRLNKQSRGSGMRKNEFGRMNTVFLFHLLNGITFLNITAIHGYYKNFGNLEFKKSFTHCMQIQSLFAFRLFASDSSYLCFYVIVITSSILFCVSFFH